MEKVLSFPYGDTEIRFYPTYSARRKTVEIAVEPTGKVAVAAPAGRSDDELISLVEKKAYWITQQLYALKSVRTQPVARELVSGESLLYLGRNYRLDIVHEPDRKKASVALENGRFRIRSASVEPIRLRDLMVGWYRRKANEKVEERIAYFAPKLGVTPKMVRIKGQEKRWGSCTKDNVLIFNWRTVLAPAPVVDYVVVHELCHLLEKQHSAYFWTLLRAVMPDFETRKQWLLENGIKLNI